MIDESDRVTNRKPPQFRLIDPNGNFSGYTAESVQFLAGIANNLWPGVEQRDFDNGRGGWDIEAAQD